MEKSITFLCGSLESGCDGVGDYTRCLSAELIRLGYKISIVALNDTYVGKVLEAKQYYQEIEIAVLRLPSTLSLKSRVKRAKEWINAFDPEWLSLQFVPYSFHSKGLPLRFDSHLKKLGQMRKWHIMFHELWVGTVENNYIKSYIISLIQRIIIKRILLILQPCVIHTHLPLYKTHIQNLGYKVKYLSLFSNIPFIDNKQNIAHQVTFRIAFFSQVELRNSILDFLIIFSKQLKDIGLNFEIILIGEATKMKKFGDFLMERAEIKESIKYTGFLAPRELSYTLQNCDLGLTSVPRHALGKSGSVAAFIAHGVPVAAPNFMKGYEKFELGFNSSNLRELILLNPDLEEYRRIKAVIKLAKGQVCAKSVAEKFILDLIDIK